MKKARLILENGAIFDGIGYGTLGVYEGELVFSTSMNGYIEAITDPSFAGQILTFSYPMIGNYGASMEWGESEDIYPKALVISDFCEDGTHAEAQSNLEKLLEDKGIGCLAGVDTREIVRIIRTKGAMKCHIEVYEEKTTPNDSFKDFKVEKDLVAQVTCTQVKEFNPEGYPRIALLDFGAKDGIVDSLVKRGAKVIQIPGTATADEIMEQKPDGILLSNGPGDPADYKYAHKAIQDLMERDIPIFGICLGHQILGIAGGMKTKKLKFGHRGINHPVMDRFTQKAYLSSQNHGYATDEASLTDDWEVWFHNLNDDTVEGLRHKTKDVCSVQFHPEANPGPEDTRFLFDDFLLRVKKHKSRNIKKILIIGSGPIVVGQAAEFDYSGAQVSLALREEGIETVIVNSNPATIQTDHEIADTVYIEPLEVPYLEKIIAKERPDGIIGTAGGQTGLNVITQLHDQKVLSKHGVAVLGTSIRSVMQGEDRGLFRDKMEEIGEPVLPSAYVHSVNEAVKFAQEYSFPILIRSAFTLGGTGSSTAHDMEEYKEKVQEGIDLSPVNQVLVEKSVLGWCELEYEMIRDSHGNKIVVCNMENMDPMGVHTGESIVAAPSQTLNDEDHQQLRTAALRIVEALDIQGGCNVQFTLNQKNGEYYVIEVNPRLSRSSALASKATGYPIARVSAKIAIGKTLPEITNAITGKTAFYEPALDYVALKIPRWPDDKFPEMNNFIGVTMKSTGEVLSMGRDFEEAMYKAIASLDVKKDVYTRCNHLDEEEIKELLLKPNSKRLSVIFAAFDKGMTDEMIYGICHMHPWFISKLRKLHENKKQIGERINTFKTVDTCAGEFEAYTPYFYSTYGNEEEVAPLDGDKAIIIGSGPIRIGQGIEFDYLTVHAVKALQKRGIKAIIVNNNPETVSTDFSVSDRLYFEPITPEFLKKIVDHEKKSGNLIGVLVQFGGQTAINLAPEIEKMGVPLIGSDSKVIDGCEDRDQTAKILGELGLTVPKWAVAKKLAEVQPHCEKLGYPVLLRPSFVLGGEGMRIIHSDEELQTYFEDHELTELASPLYIDAFIEGAVELDVDLISDGKDTQCFLLEQLDPTGIHSGDSRCVYPAQYLSEKILKKIEEMAHKIAERYQIKGVANIQFAVKEGDIYVIEINPRASRTLPFVSKCIGQSLAQIATNVALGDAVPEISQDTGGLVSIKHPVFSTQKFIGVSEDLGPLMRSTGESMTVGKTTSEALFKTSKDPVNFEVYALKSHEQEVQPTMVVTELIEETKEEVVVKKKK